MISTLERFSDLLEKYLLGLDYIVTGHEHLPTSGPYIVAAKHQSAYETLKLPLLFARPVVILKRELLRIPFWGWYAAKSGMIGIDRGNARHAIEQMIAGARNVAALNRTLVIFPQGTRVKTTDTPTTKPYKRGIGEIYLATSLPVVPMAVNTGLFWPRNAFIKRGGRVHIAFLPAIPPGLDRDTFMTTLQSRLEDGSRALLPEPPK